MKLLFLVLALLISSQAYADDKATLWLMGGKVDLNGSEHSDYKTYGGFAVEQETPSKIGTWDLGYLNEGSLNGKKRDGLYGMYKLPYKLNSKWETSVALGPYINATTQEAPGGTAYTYKYGSSLMTALSLKYKINDTWYTQLRYGHVVWSSDTWDTDQLFVGVGVSP